MEKRKVMMDTSAYVVFLKGTPVKEAVQQADEIVFNPVVLVELRACFLIERSEKRNRAILKDFFIVAINKDKEANMSPSFPLS